MNFIISFYFYLFNFTTTRLKAGILTEKEFQFVFHKFFHFKISVIDFGVYHKLLILQLTIFVQEFQFETITYQIPFNFLVQAQI
jgi:hypothetical protein